MGPFLIPGLLRRDSLSPAAGEPGLLLPVGRSTPACTIPEVVTPHKHPGEDYVMSLYGRKLGPRSARVIPSY